MEYFKVKQIVYKRYSDEIVGEYNGYLCGESTESIQKKLDLMTSNPAYQEYDFNYISIGCTKEEYEENKDSSVFFNEMNSENIQ